jgi:hypothetical protein
VRDEQDEMLDRIVNELKTLPPVPADATARVLARVDAARRGNGPSVSETDDDDDVIFFPASTEEMRAVQLVPGQAVASAAGSRVDGTLRRRFVVSLPAAIGYALAATLAGFLIRGALPRKADNTDIAATTAVGETAGVAIPVTPVAASRRALQEAPVKVQFVLDARAATSVSVVGDFNAWDGTAAPLSRDSVSGVWSALVDVTPGRHVYAFVVDGGKWTLDPRAPRTRDSDYGTEQSVMIVGLP